MCKYLMTLLLSLLPILMFAQPSTVRGEFQKVLTETPANGGTYAATGFFFDGDGLSYSIADIKTDTTMLQDSRGYLYRVVYKSGSPTNLLLEFDAIDAPSDMSNGKAQLGDPVNYDLSQNVMAETGSVVDKVRASGETRFREHVVDSLASFQTQLSAITAASNLALADQLVIADRLVSGSNTYDLKLDSFPILDIHADEYFLTDEETNATDWLSTTNRYLKKNAGLIRINSLGLDYTALQNTDGVDQLNFVWASDSELKLGSVEKEVVGVATTGPDITLTPTASTWSYEDSLSGVRGRILMNGSVIALTGTDSLVINMSGVTVDNNVDTLLVVSESGRVYKKTVASLGGGVSYDDYTSGVVASTVVRIGGTATTITSPAAGQYSFVVNSVGYVESIDFKGNNSNLDGLNQLTLIINNSTNSRDRVFNVQMIDLNSNSQVNAFVTGTNYTQTTSGNVTTIVFSNMNGFSTPGYKILLR